MAKAKRFKFSACQKKNMLPPEMLEMIFKLLNYKDICQALLVCRRWKEIIDNGNLVKKASGNNLNLFFVLNNFAYCNFVFIL